MKRLILSIFFLGGIIALQAQVIRNTHEKATDHKQIFVDKKTIERDSKELDDFKQKIKNLETAFTQRNVKETETLRKALVMDMQREIKQSENKVARAQHEIQQSKSEVRSDNREIRRDRRDFRRTKYDHQDDVRDLARDKHNRRDDRRDLRDDRRDAQAQIKRSQRQKEIFNTLRNYNFSFEGSAMEKAKTNKMLLTEFTQTMEADLAADHRELNEDKRELREDRRESRDDRREIREKY